MLVAQRGLPYTYQARRKRLTHRDSRQTLVTKRAKNLAGHIF